MIRRVRFPAGVATLLGLAALASAAPAVRWCPLPWSEVTVADFAACRGEAERCATACTGDRCPDRGSACDESADEALACSGAPCPAPERPATDDRGRAYCLAAPASATFAAGHPEPDPPAVQPAPWPVAAAVRLSFRPHPRVREPGARPPTGASLVPPPVRGPPATA